MSNKFEIENDGFVNVYTDGACFGNGQYGARAGIGVFFGDGNYLNVSKPIPSGYRTTNQVAEILAVAEAGTVAWKNDIYRLRINTDSKFIIKCVTEWMPEWKRNGWRKVDDRDIVNKEELEDMEDALAPLDVDWVYVPAHSRYYGNEMADKLAKQGAARY